MNHFPSKRPYVHLEKKRDVTCVYTSESVVCHDGLGFLPD